MNVQSKNGKPNIPWMKFALIGVVLICVAFFSGRTGIEQLLNLKPGTLGGGNAANKQDDDSSDSPNFDIDQNWKSDKTDFFVREGDEMRSPEGLTYYLGNERYESRIVHVLHHTKNDMSKPVHGVFTVSESEIFSMIDEAYRLIKSNSRKVLRTDPDGDKVAYNVDMGSKIGYKGGRDGSKSKQLTVLRLVLKNKNQVISAYPAR